MIKGKIASFRLSAARVLRSWLGGGRYGRWEYGQRELGELWETGFWMKLVLQLGHTIRLGFDCAHREKKWVSEQRAHQWQKPRDRHDCVPGILQRIVWSEDSVQRHEDIDWVARPRGLGPEKPDSGIENGHGKKQGAQQALQQGRMVVIWASQNLVGHQRSEWNHLMS